MSPVLALTFLVLTLLSAAALVALAIIVGCREKPSWGRRLFIAGTLLLAAETLVTACSAQGTDASGLLLMQRFRFLLLAILPTVWLAFSLIYARTDAASILRRNRWRLLLGLGVSLIPSLSWPLLLTPSEGRPDSLHLGATGTAAHAATLILLAFVIMHLERTLRAASGTMRWRVKFIVIGLIILFAGRIYTLVGDVLYSTVTPSTHLMAAVSALFGSLLIFTSLRRAHLQDADLHVTGGMSYRSVTVMLLGCYFLVIGLLAQWTALIGKGDPRFPLLTLGLFLVVIAWTVAAQSDRVRQAGHRLAVRCLRRPLYDYRQITTEFVARTATLTDAPTFCRTVAGFLSETLGVLSVTLWRVEASQQGLTFGGSTLLAEKQAQNLLEQSPLDGTMMALVSRLAHPLNLETTKDPLAVFLRQLTPSQFPDKGGDRICVPLIAGGEALSLLMLSDRIRGTPYTTEDFTLLNALGGQIGARLLNMQLSEGLLQSQELSAFQAMSTFFVHDLKNTAASLSLTLQNLPKHFSDPAFREDALRSISRSVDKINNLIRRFGLLNQALDMQPVATDINALISRCLDDVKALMVDRVHLDFGELPPIPVDPEQLPKVITNLLLNAREASGAEGDIKVSTTHEGDWVVITVTDRGCGMSPEFIENRLFRPFCSTKPNGMGIGLFHSRAIVKAHHGNIDVRSEEGRGSTFRVLLPIRN